LTENEIVTSEVNTVQKVRFPYFYQETQNSISKSDSDEHKSNT